MAVRLATAKAARATDMAFEWRVSVLSSMLSIRCSEVEKGSLTQPMSTGR